jgi:hypothetical protein
MAGGMKMHRGNGPGALNLRENVGPIGPLPSVQHALHAHFTPRPRNPHGDFMAKRRNGGPAAVKHRAMKELNHMRHIRLTTGLVTVAMTAAINAPVRAADETADQAEAPVPVLAQSAEAAAPTDIGPICTDRPTKSNAVCTVLEGMVQVETDLFFWSRTDLGPVRSDVLLYTNPTIKYGIGPDTDIQFNIAPIVEVRSEAGGATTSQTGTGDLFVRLKRRLTGPDSKVQVALLPFVKVPTAERGIGNREWEGGLLVPVQVPVGKATLTLVPQLNLLADALDPADRHLEFQGVVNLAFPIADRFSLAAEFWTSQNWDPARTVEQYSADAALIYLLNDDLQLEIGGNFGLNQATPDLQLYVGLSTRF